MDWMRLAHCYCRARYFEGLKWPNLSHEQTIMFAYTMYRFEEKYYGELGSIPCPVIFLAGSANGI